jgi:aspartate/methionine/tyrosine aminotransferase
VYTKKSKWFSAKKLVGEMPYPFNLLELFSFHSISKGLIGECGLRGGYLEGHNIDINVMKEILKLKSIVQCSNTCG